MIGGDGAGANPAPLRSLFSQRFVGAAIDRCFCGFAHAAILDGLRGASLGCDGAAFCVGGIAAARCAALGAPLSFAFFGEAHAFGFSGGRHMCDLHVRRAASRDAIRWHKSTPIFFGSQAPHTSISTRFFWPYAPSTALPGPSLAKTATPPSEALKSALNQTGKKVTQIRFGYHRVTASGYY